MRLLVTAGPTREHLDEVRYLSNLSSGKMGYAVAHAAAAGHRVTLVSGPTALEAPPGVERVEVESASEMLEALRARWDGAEALVMAAAVADWRPALRMPGKMKKGREERLTVEFVRTADILSELAKDKGGRVLVGFALETDALLAEASRKMTEKSLDAVVANSLENLGSENASATVLTPDGRTQAWTNLPKAEFGRRIVSLVEARGRPEAGVTPPPPAAPLGALQALAYGAVQALSAILPVSDSAHRILLGSTVAAPDAAYLALLRLPVHVAALWMLRREILALFGSRRDLLKPLALGAASAALLGGMLDRVFAPISASPAWASLGLAAFGLATLLVEKLHARTREGPWTWDRGLAVGLAQGLASAPGLSRTGLGAGLGFLTGRPRLHAAVFSLLCWIPVDICRTVLTLREALAGGEPLFASNRVLHGAFPLGALAALLASVAAFRWLLSHLRRGTFVPFGMYCFALGALALTWSLTTAKIPPLPTHEPKAGIPGVGPDGDAAAPAHEPPVLRPEGPPQPPAP